MILGQPATRTGGYQRPAGASPNFHPQLPRTRFYSGNFNPFAQVTFPMSSARGVYRPPLQTNMGPTMLPDVPAPVAPLVPKAGGVASAFSGSGFGSTGGTRMHSHVNPYMTMRQGTFPGILPSGANIRAGVRNAGARVNRSYPFQTAELPALPPPPPPMPAPSATHGLMGALFGRSKQPRCETIGPRADGLYVTICDGRVVSVQDGQGNVHTVGSDDGFMGALGFPGGRFLRRHGAWALGPAAGVGQEAWNRHRRHRRAQPYQQPYYPGYTPSQVVPQLPAMDSRGVTPGMYGSY